MPHQASKIMSKEDKASLKGDIKEAKDALKELKTDIAAKKKECKAHLTNRKKAAVQAAKEAEADLKIHAKGIKDLETAMAKTEKADARDLAAAQKAVDKLVAKSK